MCGPLSAWFHRNNRCQECSDTCNTTSEYHYPGESLSCKYQAGYHWSDWSNNGTTCTAHCWSHRNSGNDWIYRDNKGPQKYQWPTILASNNWCTLLASLKKVTFFQRQLLLSVRRNDLHTAPYFTYRKGRVKPLIENTIINKNQTGLKALTFSLTFPSPQLVEMAAHVGFDAIISMVSMAPSHQNLLT